MKSCFAVDINYSRDVLDEIECGNKVKVVIWEWNTTRTQISGNDIIFWALPYVYALKDVSIKWISWTSSASKVYSSQRSLFSGISKVSSKKFILTFCGGIPTKLISSVADGNGPLKFY
jgi:hypothetical protein